MSKQDLCRKNKMLSYVTMEQVCDSCKNLDLILKFCRLKIPNKHELSIYIYTIYIHRSHEHRTAKQEKS